MPSSLIEEPPPFDPDAQWRETLPPALRPVAERHGRPLFELCLNCLAVSERLGMMGQRVRAADAQANLAQIAQMVNNISALAVTAMGVGQALAWECTSDIQRACAIAPPQAEPEAGSAIVLPAGTVRH